MPLPYCHCQSLDKMMRESERERGLHAQAGRKPIDVKRHNNLRFHSTISDSLSLSLSLSRSVYSRLVLARVRKNGERSSYVVLQSSFSILNASAIDGFWERFTVSSLGAVPFFAGQISQSRVHHNLKERKKRERCTSLHPSVRPSVMTLGP